MGTISWSICKTFLYKLPSQQQERLLQLLPSKKRQSIRSLSPTLGDPTEGIARPIDSLATIHPSWFPPVLRQFSENEIALLLSPLPESSIKEIKKRLLLEKTISPPPEGTLPFLASFLLHQVTGTDEIPYPIECLPKTSLNSLLDIPPPKLETLAYFLGLHDLAFEIRLIIESRIIKQIEKALSKEELSYLKKIAQEKEQFSFGKMHLSRWNGDGALLRAMIESRGLNRIAKAFFQRHPSLFWHIRHRMEIQKGKQLLQLCVSADHPQIPDLLTEQIENVLVCMSKE